MRNPALRPECRPCRGAGNIRCVFGNPPCPRCDGKGIAPAKPLANNKEKRAW